MFLPEKESHMNIEHIIYIVYSNLYIMYKIENVQVIPTVLIHEAVQTQCKHML